MSPVQSLNPSSLVRLEEDSTPTMLPPPYTSPTPAEEDLDVDDEECNPQPSQTTIHINASTTIRGSHNLVTTTPLDTAHLAAAVISALRQHNAQVGAGNLHVRIDRGVSIVGDRNAVGALGIRARQPVAVNGAMAAKMAAARKRKAEEQCDSAPEAKRAVARATSCPPS